MLSVYHSTALSGWQLLGGEFHGHELTLTPPMLQLALWSEVVLYGIPYQWIKYSERLQMVVLVETLCGQEKANP